MAKPLVEIAKELGIRSKNGMTKGEFLEAIKPIMSKIPSPQLYVSLSSRLYYFRKHISRSVSDEKRLKENLAYFREPQDKELNYWGQRDDETIRIDEEGCQNAPFIWHGTKCRGKNLERFVADIDLSSSEFKRVILMLNEFLKKYKASMKIANEKPTVRSDTLNLYMTQEITPDILSEFYNIVKPILSSDFHDYLDGIPVYNNGEEIKGIKIGPEYEKNPNEYQLYSQGLQRVKDDIGWVAPLNKEIKDSIYGKKSLGEKAAAIQVLDLVYYMCGKGKSPFKLMTHDRSVPYDKRLDIADAYQYENDRKSNSQEVSKGVSQNIEETYFYRAALKSSGARPVGFENRNFQTDYPDLVDFIDKNFELQSDCLILKDAYSVSERDKYSMFSELEKLSSYNLNAYDEIYDKDKKIIGAQFNGLGSAILKDIAVAMKEKKKISKQFSETKEQNFSHDTDITDVPESRKFVDTIRIKYNLSQNNVKKGAKQTKINTSSAKQVPSQYPSTEVATTVDSRDLFLSDSLKRCTVINNSETSKTSRISPKVNKDFKKKYMLALQKDNKGR